MNPDPIWGNAADITFTSAAGDSWRWNLTRMIFKQRRRGKEIRLYIEVNREPKRILLFLRDQPCMCVLETLQGDSFCFCGIVRRPAGLIEISGLIQHCSHGMA